MSLSKPAFPPSVNPSAPLSTAHHSPSAEPSLQPEPASRTALLALLHSQGGILQRTPPGHPKPSEEQGRLQRGQPGQQPAQLSALAQGLQRQLCLPPSSYLDITWRRKRLPSFQRLSLPLPTLLPSPLPQLKLSLAILPCQFSLRLSFQ